MNEKRKTYSPEFKQKVAELSNIRGNVQVKSREPDVKAELVWPWRPELGLNSGLAFGGNSKKLITDKQQEI